MKKFLSIIGFLILAVSSIKLLIFSYQTWGLLKVIVGIIFFPIGLPYAMGVMAFEFPVFTIGSFVIGFLFIFYSMKNQS